MRFEGSTRQSITTLTSGRGWLRRVNFWPLTGWKSVCISHSSSRWGWVSARQIFPAERRIHVRPRRCEWGRGHWSILSSRFSSSSNRPSQKLAISLVQSTKGAEGAPAGCSNGSGGPHGDPAPGPPASACPDAATPPAATPPPWRSAPHRDLALAAQPLKQRPPRRIGKRSEDHIRCNHELGQSIPHGLWIYI